MSMEQAAWEARLSSLEGEVKRLKRRERGWLLAAAVLLSLGAATPAPREIRAEKFVVINSQDRACGELAGGPHGGSLDLNTLHAQGDPVGFHAQAGEMRLTEIHGDDMLYVGMLGTRCYGRLSVEPPLSAQVGQSCGIQMNAESAAPSLLMYSGQRQWGVEIGPRGAVVTPALKKQ